MLISILDSIFAPFAAAKAALHIKSGAARSGLTALLLFLPAFTAMGQTTALGVPSRNIVNLSTFCLPNTNSSGAFYYDRDFRAPFAAPAKGYSLVITDIFIDPFCSTGPNTTDRFGVVVSIGNSRTFTAGFTGAETKHYSFAGGLVVPEGDTLSARSWGSTTLVQVQIMGYFVKDGGLGGGKIFVFQ